MGKIIITSYGRSGTSLLVYLFTLLEYSTGFTPEVCAGQLKAPHHAGLERMQFGPPVDHLEVIKNPDFCHTLQQYVKGGKEKIDDIVQIIIPLRGVMAAAESRYRNNLLWSNKGGYQIAGEKDKVLQNEKKYNGQSLGFLMDTIFLNDIPYTILKFPYFTRNARYTYFKLKPVLDLKNISYKTFKKAFLKAVDKNKIFENK